MFLTQFALARGVGTIGLCIRVGGGEEASIAIMELRSYLAVRVVLESTRSSSDESPTYLQPDRDETSTVTLETGLRESNYDNFKKILIIDCEFVST